MKTNWIQRLLNRLGLPAGASVSVDVAAVKAETAAIKAITDALPNAGALTTIQADLDNPAQYKADLTTLETRLPAVLSAVRIAYLDQLDFALQEAIAALQTDLDNPDQYKATGFATAATWTAALATALSAYTAAKAAFIDVAISSRATEAKQDIIDTNVDDIETLVGAITAAGPTNVQMNAARDAIIAAIPAMVGTDGAALAADWTGALATALTAYTAAKAAFIDVAISSRAPAATALSNAMWTDAKAGYLTAAVALASVCTAGRLGELDAGNIPGDIDTLLVRLPAILSAARIGYLDNINQAGLLQVTAARAALLDQITAARLAELDPANLPTDVANVKTETALIKTETDQLPNVQHETEWSSTPTIQALANAAATALTAGSITPTYPVGATRTRAILLATIHVANKTAAAHHISFKVQGQKQALGYGDQLDLSAQEGLSMVDVDGATDGWSGAIDVTALVDTSAVAYTFRFEVDSDNAGNVIYICSFVLALVYTM